MEFRKAVKEDIEDIMVIIRQAQDYFMEQGISQWQNNYPSVEIVEKDIEDSVGYVLLKEDKIIGTAVISFDGEKTYDDIYEGRWLSNSEYAVIHRIAVNDEHKGLGLAALILENVERLCFERGVNSIKIDTHKENLSMQNLLRKNKFEYCGIIYLEDKSERLAFEKIL